MQSAKHLEKWELSCSSLPLLVKVGAPRFMGRAESLRLL